VGEGRGVEGEGGEGGTGGERGRVARGGEGRHPWVIGKPPTSGL